MFCLRAPLEVEVRRDVATLSRGERIRDLVKAHGVRTCGKGLRGGAIEVRRPNALAARQSEVCDDC